MVERADPVAGGDVEGENVVGGDLTGAACRHPRRTGLGKAAGDVNGAADDHFTPYDPIDLPCRQRVRAHCGRCVGRRHGIRLGGLTPARADDEQRTGPDCEQGSPEFASRCGAINRRAGTGVSIFIDAADKQGPPHQIPPRNIAGMCQLSKSTVATTSARLATGTANRYVAVRAAPGATRPEKSFAAGSSYTGAASRVGDP